MIELSVTELYTVIVDAANPNLTLRPGMTAKVSIVAAAAQNVLRVSNAALKYTPAQAPADQAAAVAAERKKLQAGSGIVWTEDALGGLRAGLIHTGIAGGSYSEILGGDITAGARIVTGLKTATSAATDPFANMPPPMMFDGGNPPPPPPTK